jgi:hypothetical protein
MKRKSLVHMMLAMTVAVMLAAVPAMAQKTAGKPAEAAGAPQITGELGSPSASTTISGKQLPPPDPKFGGVIKDGALQSKAWWAPRVVPPKQAPNILLIMTDDSGFGVPSTFGGVNDEDYRPPFTLTAQLNKLTIKVARPQLSPEDIKKLEEGMKQAADAK